VLEIMIFDCQYVPCTKKRLHGTENKRIRQKVSYVCKFSLHQDHTGRYVC
jgi:hypothetical protein